MTLGFEMTLFRVMYKESKAKKYEVLGQGHMPILVSARIKIHHPLSNISTSTVQLQKPT